MTDHAPIRCIIVDDEPLAVALLADYVSKTPGLQTVLRTTHVLEALQAVQEDRADLLFLDIQMPELTGIQFMKIIRKKCKVILTTAYSQYALEGYEHDVVDYLLKPVTLDRFIIAIQKAKDRLGISVPQPADAAETPAVKKQDHVFIKTEYRIQRVNLADISYIEALRDYVAFHIGAEKILTLESMRHMEEILPDDHFIRIHKSYIVNRSKIDYLERSRVVIGKEYLPIGDTYKEKVRLKLGLL
jgi:DNA-binding LytR/AlgR family response regulator